MTDWHDTPEWASLNQSQKDLFNDVIANDGPLSIKHPSIQQRGDASTLAILGMITYRPRAYGTELTEVPYSPQPPVRTQVTQVDFAVPGHYDIGVRFPSWDAAVAHARNKITVHRYAGQKLRPEAPDFHPKQHVQDGDGLISYSRAFVQMRVVEPIQERGDGAGPCGSDGVVMTWEVFNDGTVEAVPDSSPKPSAAPENTRPQIVEFSRPGETVTGILLPPEPSDTSARVLGVTERDISISELLREKDVEIARLRKEATEMTNLYDRAEVDNDFIEAAQPDEPDLLDLAGRLMAVVTDAWLNASDRTLPQLHNEALALLRLSCHEKPAPVSAEPNDLEGLAIAAVNQAWHRDKHLSELHARIRDLIGVARRSAPPNVLPG